MLSTDLESRASYLSPHYNLPTLRFFDDWDSLQGLTFWDGKNQETKAPNEIHYETRSGDLAFIDRCVVKMDGFFLFLSRSTHAHRLNSRLLSYSIARAVWHQADPITKGTRWALVIFYSVAEDA